MVLGDRRFGGVALPKLAGYGSPGRLLRLRLGFGLLLENAQALASLVPVVLLIGALLLRCRDVSFRDWCGTGVVQMSSRKGVR